MSMREKTMREVGIYRRGYNIILAIWIRKYDT